MTEEQEPYDWVKIKAVLDGIDIDEDRVKYARSISKSADEISALERRVEALEAEVVVLRDVLLVAVKCIRGSEDNGPV